MHITEEQMKIGVEEKVFEVTGEQGRVGDRQQICRATSHRERWPGERPTVPPKCQTKGETLAAASHIQQNTL